MNVSIQNILQEYKRLRTNGLETNEAVSALHPHIRMINQEMRDLLAQNMRAWEHQRTDETISDTDRHLLAQAQEVYKAQNTIKCPECGKPNMQKDEICFACGSLLNPNAVSSTQQLSKQMANVYETVRFTIDDILMLMPKTEHASIKIPIHASSAPLTLGRGHEDVSLSPDIDLSYLNAGKLGVSRIHAAISYEEETLYLIDMGSTNGSYLNEQKLHPKERRVIRHEDTIRLGHLELKVFYKQSH